MNTAGDLSRVSFLVIDDNVHMRSILRSILSGFGARSVYEAAEGADGLETVLDRSPDVVLCDWVMNPLNGADFVRTLRAERDRYLRTLPIIIVSAYSQKSTILEAVNLGIHGFIAKPVSPAILYQRVSHVLTNQALHGRTKGIMFGGDYHQRKRSPAARASEMDDHRLAEQPNAGEMALI